MHLTKPTEEQLEDLNKHASTYLKLIFNHHGANFINVISFLAAMAAATFKANENDFDIGKHFQNLAETAAQLVKDSTPETVQ